MEAFGAASARSVSNSLRQPSLRSRATRSLFASQVGSTDAEIVLSPFTCP